MQARNGDLLLSPSDVTNFLACEHRTALDLLRARGELELRRIPRPDAELVAERGRQLLREVDGPMLRTGLQDFHREAIILPRRPADRPDPQRLEARFERFLSAAA